MLRSARVVRRRRRIVHVDDAAEELVHLRRQVDDGGGAPAGAEDLGVATDREDVAVQRHGPKAKVVVLPYARYQMPSDMIRMPASQEFAEAAD